MNLGDDPGAPGVAPAEPGAAGFVEPSWQDYVDEAYAVLGHDPTQADLRAVIRWNRDHAA